jgi:hypothetical protein
MPETSALPAKAGGKEAEMDSSSQHPRDFSQLFDWHLNHGTRPQHSPSSQGIPWTSKEFSRAMVREIQKDVTDRTIRNWRSGRTVPNDILFIESIEHLLFGENSEYQEWRSELRQTFADAIRKNKQEAVLRLLKHPIRGVRVAARHSSILPSLMQQSRIHCTRQAS